ncbi:hypothetical protein D3C87_1968740 [compost metagenome]
MVLATSFSEARPERNSLRIAFSAFSRMANEPDCFRLSIAERTSAGSRSFASNRSRSKLDEIWMSIDGDVVALTSRIS